MTNATEYAVKVGSERNYSMLYSTADDAYAALWVAYPLAKGHTSGSATSAWKKNPDIAQDDQINVWSGAYGVSYGSTQYARGHQIPNADRKSDAFNSQTYYATNCTPQIQDKFNGGVWSSLENAIRGLIPQNDTLYIATGPVYRTVGGSESITLIQPQYDTKKVAVPNYYYKVVLKVKRDSSGAITDALAIGFWLPHEQTSASYTTFATSVDVIEAKTGFDFFANLPSQFHTAAESNKSWTAFQSF